MAEDTVREVQPIDLSQEVEVISPEPQDKTEYLLKELLDLEETEEPYLFAPIFAKSGIAVVTGGPDTGKSSLLRQLCLSVASGRNYLDWEYKGDHNKAIYFSSEDDEKLTARVVKRYNRTMQIPQECQENVRFVFEINPDDIAKKVEEMLTAEVADLVVIDALGDAFNGKNLNDSKDVRAFYNQFTPIARRFNCLIIFNHHTGKRTGVYAPDQDNALGSGAITQKPRIAIELRPDPTDPEIKHFCITKCNYGLNEFKGKKSVVALRMNEDLVFEATGEQKEIADLAKDLKKQDAKPKNPKKIADDDHKEFIRGIFQKSENGKLDLKTIKENVEIEFDVSDKTARTFITHYKNKSWIEFSERGIRRSELYKSNL